jgi:hypothetical protein
MSGVTPGDAAKAEVTASAGAVVHQDLALDSKRIDTLPILTIVRTSGRIETISIWNQSSKSMVPIKRVHITSPWNGWVSGTDIVIQPEVTVGIPARQPTQEAAAVQSFPPLPLAREMWQDQNFCLECGSCLTGHGTFCSKCGTAIRGNAGPPAAPPAATNGQSYTLTRAPASVAVPQSMMVNPAPTPTEAAVLPRYEQPETVPDTFGSAPPAQKWGQVHAAWSVDPTAKITKSNPTAAFSTATGSRRISCPQCGTAQPQINSLVQTSVSCINVQCGWPIQIESVAAAHVRALGYGINGSNVMRPPSVPEPTVINLNHGIQARGMATGLEPGFGQPYIQPNMNGMQTWAVFNTLCCCWPIGGLAW